ncbi:hypothetical protein [Mangrovimonas sp. TPBH4]|uniref:hypothetical protein n=1 Tax=Mangrovimonas sp. TPBH4 TaxID=1645914 RepID=UPI0006B4C55B|nr:hypothetical protein [Mangrovimonas sp. TPBH4]
MKSLLTYYFLSFTPFIILLLLMKEHLIDPILFLGLLFFYVLIYRTYLDGKRLADKSIIKQNEIWKMIIPGKRLEHFKELYLK